MVVVMMSGGQCLEVSSMLHNCSKSISNLKPISITNLKVNLHYRREVSVEEEEEMEGEEEEHLV